MEYIVVIDTNKYAGNFEREMCAYITRQVGSCGVGQDFADIAEKELTEEQAEWFEDNISSQPDDNGCWRPCEIWLDRCGAEYNSVAIFLESAPDRHTIALVHSRAKSFEAYHEGLVVEGIRLLKVIPERYEEVDV